MEEIEKAKGSVVGVIRVSTKTEDYFEGDETKKGKELVKVNSQPLSKINDSCDVRPMPKEIEELLNPNAVLKNDSNQIKSIKSMLDVSAVDFDV
uniref:Uncharacterized protein n=1 Tax=Lactuca sativa TaxID=4236 RepID=A0A9R1W6P3_LACSA|nr:hypothetical protein LSAT_V11C300153330 [Lactuca sativa]